MNRNLFRKIPVICLTLILTTGVFIPACDPLDEGVITLCDCSSHKYFDVQGLAVLAVTDLRTQKEIPENDTLQLAEFDGLFIDYIVEYHARSKPTKSSHWSFSLMNTAMACSCVAGPAGSKNEKLESLIITTINDFDEEHKANESINDLLVYKGSIFNSLDVSLEEFISSNKDMNLLQENMYLQLTKAPVLNSNFQVKISMKLSTGETYEVESKAFVLNP